MVLASLDRVVEGYCALGVAPSTKRAYSSAYKQFNKFCLQYNVTDPFPVSESLLCYFVSFLAQEGLAPNSIKLYLAAVRHFQILMGLPELRAESSLPRLRLVLNGITRARMSDDRTLRSKPRLPITVDILHRIFTVLSRGSPSYTDHLVWAACALSFFGFFRAGEITVPSQSVLQQSKHLGWGDVCVDSIFSPSLLRVHLKVSKCDQFGSGADIYIGKTSDEICPVAACLSYMQLRGHQAGPFFCFRKNIPLTKGTFVAHVRKALTQAGLDASLYSGHSFCIGAATSAAQAGVEDSVIKALGRWSSAAFLLYIRTPREKLTHFSAAISGHVRR